jgi:predicted NBD/HSP70 family sugar kinase
LDKCLAHAAVGRGRLAAASIGTTGVVDRETGTVTFAPQLPGWQGRAVKPALEDLLGVPVLLENEAHLAMLGESWRGIATDVGDAVLIQFGVGVGMGILIGGEIYRGAKGAAGEIGYLPIGDTVNTPEGGPGRFETTVGSLAISRHMARASTGAGRRVRGSSENAQRRDVSAAEVFARASEGDRAAQQAIGDVLSYLAAGLAAVSAVLNPELIVLGGGLAASLAPHVERLQAELLRRVPAGPRVQLSALGDSAVAVGAVKRAVTFAETGLFDAISLA